MTCPPDDLTGKAPPAVAPHPAATEDNPLPPRRDNLHATAQTTGIAIMPRRFGDLKLFELITI